MNNFPLFTTEVLSQNSNNQKILKMIVVEGDVE